MAVTLEDRLVVGDGSALRDLFNQYSPLIARLSEDVLGEGREPAVDRVTADVVAEAWNARSEFDPSKGSVRAWLVAMTRVRLADEEGLSLSEADLVQGEAIDQHLVATVLGSMPDIRRDILFRGLYRGDEEEEMASDLDMPVGAVAAHLRRGLEALRDELGDSLPDGEDVMDRLSSAVDSGPMDKPLFAPSPSIWELVVDRAEVDDDDDLPMSFEDLWPESGEADLDDADRSDDDHEATDAESAEGEGGDPEDGSWSDIENLRSEVVYDDDDGEGGLMAAVSGATRTGPILIGLVLAAVIVGVAIATMI